MNPLHLPHIPKLKLLTSIFLLILTSHTWAQPASGIFKMGLISSTIEDSSRMEDVRTHVFIEEIRTGAEHDMYFTSDEVMTVVKSNGVVLMELLDIKSKLHYSLAEADRKKWYVVDSLPQDIMDSLAQSELSPDMMDTLNRLIQVSSRVEDQKMIFGFPCEKVTLMSPENLNELWATAYCTRLIPIFEFLGPFSKHLPGVALETTMAMEGVRFTIGALAFTPKTFKSPHFGVRLSRYKKVTAEELHDLITEAMGK